MKKSARFAAAAALIAIVSAFSAACAHVSPIVITEYTVMFVSNGGTKYNTVTVDVGKSIELPAPERNGYVFDGWFLNSDLSGDAVISPFTPEKNTTLYAGWTDITSEEHPYLYFHLNDNQSEYTVWSMLWDSNVTNVVIPSTFRGLPVTSVHSSAFNYRDIISVEFPSSIKEIDDQTFFQCKNLTTVKLPEGFEKISYGAFYNCEKLSSIELPKSLKIIYSYAFEGCISLNKINLKEGLEYIGFCAFEDCALTNVIIPASVTYVGSYAFWGCPIKTIHCRAQSQPSGWADNWNEMCNAEIEWNCRSN